MGQSVFLFVTSPKNIDEFTEEIGAIFDVELEEVIDDDRLFEFWMPEINLQCFICNNVHDLGDLSSQNYQYQLKVFAWGSENSREKQIDHGRSMFASLKETKLYNLLLVMGFWKILDQFDVTSVAPE
jgi:hypothetical protein